MSYYTGVGDYYSGKGDPGFTSILSGILGTASKVASVIPGVGSAISAVTGTAARILQPSTATTARPTLTTPARPLVAPSIPSIPVPKPGPVAAVQRLIPGGASGYTCPSSGGCGSGFHMDKATRSRCVRNRRTNYTNPRALARASRRLDGFVSVARKAMKSTNYKVVSKSYKQNWRKPLKK